MELTQNYLQALAAEIKTGGVDKISFEDLETRLEKLELTPEQNAEISQCVEDIGGRLVDTFASDTSAL